MPSSEVVSHVHFMSTIFEENVLSSIMFLPFSTLMIQVKLVCKLLYA